MTSKRSLKLPIALLIAALLALGLAACGGGDSAPSIASSTGSETSSSEAAGEEDGSGAASNSKNGSASFIVPGGDNSIQTYGEEADSAELKAAEEALNGYLEARAGAEWAKSCVYLTKGAIAPLTQLAARTPQFKGANCGEILAKLQKTVSPSGLANTMTKGLASLRVEGERGFALYHGAGGIDYFVLMEKEGGDWKVAGLTPSEFPS